MAFEVIWSDFADEKLAEIFEYYFSNASEKVAKKLVPGLISNTFQLSEQPHSGPPESLLSDREIPYRYLVWKNHKIIYSVDEENSLVKIADVFDTRQIPKKILRNK